MSQAVHQRESDRILGCKLWEYEVTVKLLYHWHCPATGWNTIYHLTCTLDIIFLGGPNISPDIPTVIAPGPSYQNNRARNEPSQRFHNHRGISYQGLLLVESAHKVIRDGQRFG